MLSVAGWALNGRKSHTCFDMLLSHQVGEVREKCLVAPITNFVRGTAIGERVMDGADVQGRVVIGRGLE